VADGLRSQLFVRHADGPTLFMLRAIPLGGFALTDALRWRSLLRESPLCLRRMIYPYSLGQNGHDFVGSAGGDGGAPVVGFGVVELVQAVDGGADGADAAE